MHLIIITKGRTKTKMLMQTSRYAYLHSVFCTVLKSNQKFVQNVVFLHSALINKRETRFGTFRNIFMFSPKNRSGVHCAKWFIRSKERKFKIRKILNCNSEAPNASLIPSRFMIFFCCLMSSRQAVPNKGWWMMMHLSKRLLSFSFFQ